MINPFIKDEAIDEDKFEETNNEDHLGRISSEAINVNIGTVQGLKCKK